MNLSPFDFTFLWNELNCTLSHFDAVIIFNEINAATFVEFFHSFRSYNQ